VGRPAGTALLTGLPSSGKTTLARAVRDLVASAGGAVEVLDGDEVRRALWPELGLSRADRAENLDRMGHVAIMLARHGVLALVAAIAPYAVDRERLRTRHAAAGVDLVEIHVATPPAVCRDRDVKGLYARQARGELGRLTGVDAPYEEPALPDLRIDTSGESVGESAGRLLDLLVRCGLAAPALTPQRG